MKGTVLYGPRDVRFEELDDPKIIKPTDAIIRISATCVCGSDLWPYRGLQPVNEPTPMGHEYCGIVEEVGSAVTRVKRGQFIIGSFFASDNTCPTCQIGYQSSCQHRELFRDFALGRVEGHDPRGLFGGPQDGVIHDDFIEMERNVILDLEFDRLVDLLSGSEWERQKARRDELAGKAAADRVPREIVIVYQALERQRHRLFAG